MSDAYKINRQDIEKIVPGKDHRIIRAFESIFRDVPENRIENQTLAADSRAAANRTNARAIHNDERISGNEVLLWLTTT